MEYKTVRDKAGASRRHYKRECADCGKIDWVLTTRLKSKCTDCKINPRTKEDYSKVSKENWSKEEYRKNHAEAMQKTVKRGEDHHWWKGGKAKPRSFSPEYVEWRTSVYKRDNYTCQHCNEVGSKLNAHHIIPWSVNEEKRFDIKNGSTLCYKCHVEVHKKDGGFYRANLVS